MIVTSRPISSGELHPHVSSRVEIIGFTPEELTHYFNECLSGDSVAVEQLLERVRENPVVESSCYLPLNAAIIVHLFISGNQILPTTVHGIFTSLVKCCLSRYLKERLDYRGEVANIESLGSLPECLQEPFRQLCFLAFSGVTEDKVTFPSFDLKALGIRTDVSALGLVQAVPTIVSDKTSVYYNFLHLSVQELLAAIHISGMSGSEQISQFQQLFDEPRFTAVFQFYAGITRFKSERKYLSRVSFLLPTRFIPTSIRDVVTKMVQQPFPLKDGSIRYCQYLVSVLNCLFEAGDPSLCQYVAKQMRTGWGRLVHATEWYDLHLSHATLSPLDCMSLGYFLSCVSATTPGVFRVSLWSCSIGDHGCKFLVRGVSRCCTSSTTVTGRIDMELGGNPIHEEGARHIAHILNSTLIVRRLSLSYNDIGMSGLKSITEALVTNSSLVELNLTSCSVKITEENGPVLREMLQRNSTLKVLNLTRNGQVSDTGASFIAEGLKENTSLRTLSLCFCNIRDEGVMSLGEALVMNTSLKILNLFRNNDITEQGVSVLIECLKRNRGLVLLRIPCDWNKYDIQKAVNVTRRRSGAPLIRVYFEGDRNWDFSSRLALLYEPDDL